MKPVSAHLATRIAITGIATAVLLSPSSASHAREQSTITDPSSGVRFPTSIEMGSQDLASASTHTLLGTGVRTKTFFRVKVYAVGLYVERADAADLSESVRAGRMGRTLLLVTTRGIDGDSMRDAFTDAMLPRFRRALNEHGRRGTPADWDVFTSLFETERLEKDTELAFSCDTDSVLTGAMGGVANEPIESDALCWALFDVYLGDKPISNKLKRQLLEKRGSAR